MKDLLTKGEYKVINELEKHSNKDKLINISITLNNIFNPQTVLATH